MKSLEEITKINNPKGDHEEYITKVEKNPKGKIINVSRLTYEEAQEELNKIFGGR